MSFSRYCLTPFQVIMPLLHSQQCISLIFPKSCHCVDCLTSSVANLQRAAIFPAIKKAAQCILMTLLASFSGNNTTQLHIYMCAYIYSIHIYIVCVYIYTLYFSSEPSKSLQHDTTSIKTQYLDSNKEKFYSY